MFIDEAEIYVKAGKGGDGAVSFRREKFIAKGGPDGGDGGNGGSIILKVDSHCHGLAEYNRQKNFMAESGINGMGQKKKGRNGKDLVLLVPPGTQIYQKDELLFDLTEENEEVVLCKGGSGGWGNQHFATSIKQTPRWAKNGTRGESMKVRLELKTIADVGLIGFPNAGKSTLLSVLSNARPKIADYPFTTLEPNLGVIKGTDQNIIIADIPGLIAGASEGKGLGDKFLRHIERTKILVHIIDANSSDVVHDYKIIRKELTNFSKKLTKKKEFIVLNKIDTVTTPDLEQKILELKTKKIKPIVISAVTHKNIDQLISMLKKALEQ